MVKVDCALDVKARLGEGAVWDDLDQALWWVDIEAPSLNRFDPATGKNQAWPMPSRIGCFALREGGGFVTALQDGFKFFDPQTGAFEAIADPEAHLPGNRFNDGATDAAGRFIAGTMPMGERKPVSAFYRLNTDRSVETLFTGLTVTNGSTFSPDGRIFYFSDSAADVRTIWACDYEPETGAVRNRRVFLDTHGLKGRPDGGTVDAEGCYWMAGVGGWEIVRVTPDGRVDMEIEMPCERPTKIAFGGAGLDVLYVTSIGEGPSKGTEARQPQAGGIFALRVPGVTGVPPWRFKG